MSEFGIEEAVRLAREGTPVETTPRRLLSWVGASRRGSNVVEKLRRKMQEAEVTTTPDFEGVYIDRAIRLHGINDTGPNTEENGNDGYDLAREEDGVRVATEGDLEPAHWIGRLEAATNSPLMVSLSDSVGHAITLMLQHEYSQLPVKRGPNKIAGMISWRSIGKKLHLLGACESVQDCLEKHYEVKDTASLFEVIQWVTRHDSVIVKTGSDQISGIITNADISREFRRLAEPFLLLGDIENALRRLIDQRFSPTELQESLDPNQASRTVESASDLTFGEYLRLMQKPENWDRFGLNLERTLIVNQLNEVREIRNEVMHFNNDPLEGDSTETLRSAAHFLTDLLDTIR